MTGVTTRFTGMIKQTNEDFVETIRERAEEEADATRHEVGGIVIDATGEYFPEAVKRRRRRDIASGFVLGALVGFLVRHVVGER